MNFLGIDENLHLPFCEHLQFRTDIQYKLKYTAKTKNIHIYHANHANIDNLYFGPEGKTQARLFIIFLV